MRALVPVLLLLVACGPRAGRLEAMAESATIPPFTAEEIREAMPVGLHLRTRTEAVGEPVRIDDWRVVSSNEGGVVISYQVLDEEGRVVSGPDPGADRWEDLRDHAAFPEHLTTVSAEEIEVPAGTFAAWRYTVVHPESGTRVYWFSPDLPGPPVRTVHLEDGVEVVRTELLLRE